MILSRKIKFFAALLLMLLGIRLSLPFIVKTYINQALHKLPGGDGSVFAINLDGASVWLDVPIETVIARLPADGRRPLSADRTQMERLFAMRQAAYSRAHYRIDATVPPQEIAERILDAVKVG